MNPVQPASYPEDPPPPYPNDIDGAFTLRVDRNAPRVLRHNIGPSSHAPSSQPGASSSQTTEGKLGKRQRSLLKVATYKKKFKDMFLSQQDPVGSPASHAQRASPRETARTSSFSSRSNVARNTAGSNRAIRNQRSETQSIWPTGGSPAGLRKATAFKWTSFCKKFNWRSKTSGRLSWKAIDLFLQALANSLWEDAQRHHENFYERSSVQRENLVLRYRVFATLSVVLLVWLYLKAADHAVQWIRLLFV